MSFLLLVVLSSIYHIPFVTQFLVFLVGTVTLYVAVILYTPLR